MKRPDRVSEDARRAFVERLRGRRIELGLRLEDVARHLGVANMTVHRWELSKRSPRAGMAARWAGVLGVRVVGGSLAGLFRPEVPPCGTRGRYARHRAAGERCPTCWAAHSRYVASSYTPRPRPWPFDRHRDAVVSLLSLGFSAAAIARRLDVPQSTARDWVKKLRPQVDPQAVSTEVDAA